MRPISLPFLSAPVLGAAALISGMAGCSAPPTQPSGFVLADSVMFAAGHALTNAVADFDLDGDQDLFVGFGNLPNRLYRNDAGRFTDVAPAWGIKDSAATRSAAWGDVNLDGRPDLFVGFGAGETAFARLYMQVDGRFVDEASERGVTVNGAFRQASFVDFDRDGDNDLFLAFRDRANAMLRNDDGLFVDVAVDLGLADERRSVGASWFDFDRDGDLDLIVANMDGDANGLFRNDGASFTDVAIEAGLADGGRGLGDESRGTVRPVIVDYDSDGYFDVFMANYGPNGLFRNLGNGHFENLAEPVGIAMDGRFDTGAFADFDLDGRLDLYVNGTITGGTSYPDYLFRGQAGAFLRVIEPVLEALEADHGAAWFDYDADGDPDLALTGAAATGTHQLVRNTRSAGRSIQVRVLDAERHATTAGWEVRVYDAASDSLLGAQIVDSGSGYNSQGLAPLLFGLADGSPVDVELTALTVGGRRVTRIEGVDPSPYLGRSFQIAPVK